MLRNGRLCHLLLGAVCAFAALDARAQADYSAYGVLDFSYGRFEPAGLVRVNRFNSNSLSATFVGVTAKYGLEGGWVPGVTLETFLRFQDLKTGRNDNDPLLSRNAFAFLGSEYGTLKAGRIQTLLFDTTSRFNALGNSAAFSPAIRHVFASGNLQSVQGDFYWDRAIGYSSPNWDGVTVNTIYSQEGALDRRGNRTAGSVVMARGLFAGAVSAQRVYVNDGIADPTKETAWQVAATYKFELAQAFALYTRTQDQGLDVRGNIASVGAALPLGPGTVQGQLAVTTATGPAVNIKHTSTSMAYLYPVDSVTDLYVIGMDDRSRGFNPWYLGGDGGPIQVLEKV